MFYSFSNIFLDVNSVAVKTEDIVVVSQENDSIILNCSFSKKSNEEFGRIRWQKKLSRYMTRDLAQFSLPGGPKPFIAKEMQDYYKNRTYLIGPNTSLVAVMIIKEPVCGDEGEYYCTIGYYDYYPKLTIYDWEYSSTLVVFNGKDILLTVELILKHEKYEKHYHFIY